MNVVMSFVNLFGLFSGRKTAQEENPSTSQIQQSALAESTFTAFSECLGSSGIGKIKVAMTMNLERCEGALSAAESYEQQVTEIVTQELATLMANIGIRGEGLIDFGILAGTMAPLKETIVSALSRDRYPEANAVRSTSGCEQRNYIELPNGERCLKDLIDNDPILSSAFERYAANYHFVGTDYSFLGNEANRRRELISAITEVIYDRNPDDKSPLSYQKLLTILDNPAKYYKSALSLINQRD